MLPILTHHTCIWRSRIAYFFGIKELNPCAVVWHWLHEPEFNRNTSCDIRTVTQTDGHSIYCASMSSHTIIANCVGHYTVANDEAVLAVDGPV